MRSQENYVPADEAISMLLQVRNDPQAFFMPTIQRGGQSYFVGGLPGIAPGLSDLFTFPTNVLRRGQNKDALDEDDRRKRQRLGEGSGDDDEANSIEMGRRAESRALSDRHSVMISKDVGAFDDTFGGDFGDLGAGLDAGLDNGEGEPFMRDPSVAPSIAQTERLQSSDEDCLIAIFDSRQQTGGASQTATQTGASTIADESASAASRRRNGYSQNTVKAEGLIRQQVGVEKDGFMVPFPSHGAGGPEMSFEKVAAKVSLAMLVAPISLSDNAALTGLAPRCRILLLRAARSRDAGQCQDQAGPVLRRHQGLGQTWSVGKHRGSGGVGCRHLRMRHN